MDNSITESIDKLPTKNDEEQEFSPFEKIIQLNKLGALFLSSDKYDKALNILKKTYDFYLEKKTKREIPNFFYSNLYCNLAKTYSCLKDFKNAQPIYTDCILNNSLYKILLVEKEFIKEKFMIDIDRLLEIDNLKPGHFSEINKKFKILMEYFTIDKISKENDENIISLREEFYSKILKRFKPNKLNSLSSFTDCLVNLAVIFQYFYKESITSFNMYYLAILLDPYNVVANVDLNNFLRENNFKENSDEYIIKRITYDYVQDNLGDNKDINGNDPEKNKLIPHMKIQQVSINEMNQSKKSSICNDKKKLSFVCMKWGTKYNAEYVNKLYRGLRRNTNREFNFYCITDDNKDLDSNINPIKLITDFKGWMRKSVLFSDDYLAIFTQKEEEYICFIDLDMIIYNSIDYLWDYNGDFCLMKTDDIQCENSVDGYNSSIILWKKDFGKEIYDNMKYYVKYLTCQVIRFDHYLEFVIKNSDFIQDVFPGKVLDYNTYCKGNEVLSENGAIIAFPRYPKPHECKEEWVMLNWK